MRGLPGEYEIFAIDHDKQLLILKPWDGERIEIALPADAHMPKGGIRYTWFDAENWVLGAYTKLGDPVFFDVYNPTNPDAAPPRPTLYLDQNMWSRIAVAQLDLTVGGDDEETQAARELVRLVRDGGVIVPFSAAHLTETGFLHSQRRYEVGIVIADLSRGWQMRDVRNVLEQEAHDALETITDLPAHPALGGR